MPEVVRNQPSAIEQRSERAHQLEQEIVLGCQTIHRAWFLLAGYLHEMQTDQLYELRGCETFEEWLGSPEVSLSRSHAYALVGIHVEYVVERGYDPAELAPIEATKLAETLPALRRGIISPVQLLDDAEHLSRSDLREKYRKNGNDGEILDAETERPICPACGQRTKAKKS